MLQLRQILRGPLLLAISLTSSLAAQPVEMPAQFLASPFETECVPHLLLCGQIAISELTTEDCSLTTGGFTDLWFFPVQSRQFFTVVTVSQEFDTFLRVLDPTPRVVASNDDIAPGSTDSGLGLTASRAGLWAAAVSSFDPAETGTYGIGVSCRGACVPDGNTAQAQVTATQAEAGRVTEISSPMQLDVSLGADGKRRPFNLLPLDQSRVHTETAAYICDKAKVRSVQIVRRKAKRGMVRVEVSPALSTGWMRQDINLTISLMNGDQVVAKKHWRGITIGDEENAAAKMGAVWASSSKSPKATFDLTEEAFAAMFADGAAPAVRIVLDIPE